ncbi:MAG TPA: hypothetical protein VLA61_18270 [Ideonella sp.]|uniref:hypothetical protein n=1 Tax=Ideonella sp. TaxID=1929293 RepID=UPI002BC1240D|nr:hypothetical protein [Ideonella sp.]HSI50222.1 hypothetical protein [Ideonella sp.]
MIANPSFHRHRAHGLAVCLRMGGGSRGIAMKGRVGRDAGSHLYRPSSSHQQQAWLEDPTHPGEDRA